METSTVQPRPGDTLTADEAFDLVIGDLEQGVPDHQETRMMSFPHSSSCAGVYCCF
ncbi:hypothetical protein OHS33_00690 [Streptomyces sp. NBC_00536]|uniref:hypothetical protein n=1 Tax=Streptomyces sp. NBC_00536 TaxID=2975769 RepID=UPI002E81531B|nr:hypothetical protein [Streptomyces sp. NBC_00536]WUC76991.1 hypothetical protein OHS33_00690 [Streptomyces sp. NBC_00536]